MGFLWSKPKISPDGYTLVKNRPTGHKICTAKIQVPKSASAELPAHDGFI
jgi:hypothetical protein